MDEDPELTKLRALAKEQDRLEEQDRLDGLPWKNQVKQPEVSVRELKALGGKVVKAKTGGGKKEIVEIIFGRQKKGETQLTFRPKAKLIYGPLKDRLDQAELEARGRLDQGFARWTVSLKGKTSRYDSRRPLNKSTRQDLPLRQSASIKQVNSSALE
jgi:hypothetical protein